MIFDCDEQIGGFKIISFSLLTETSNWPIVLTDTTSNQIILTRELNSICGTLVKDSIKVKERSRTTQSGQLWQITISFEFNLQDAALEQLLDQYANKPGVCEVEKLYGPKKLFGSNHFPMLMTYRSIHGEKPEDGTQTYIEMKGEMPHRPVYIIT